jgi:hypothetical protein
MTWKLQRPQQPDDLDVATTLRLQPTARPHPIQITVDVELKEIARRVAKPARRLGFDAQKARSRQIKPINEGVDKTRRLTAST